jgi:hypothetical protein
MLDFFKDIFSAFRQNSLERMKSPFLGAFTFCWLGFNWQSLAILFFSKKTVEDRITYITTHHDMGAFILGPIITTILICLLLPHATKLIIRFQSKPISEAIQTTMDEKIALAEKQLEIADIESRKKLSDKREERNIEEGIKKIKSDAENIEEQNNQLRNKVKILEQNIIDSASRASTIEAQNVVFQQNLSYKDSELTQKKKELENLETERGYDLATLNNTIVELTDRDNALRFLKKELPMLFIISPDPNNLSIDVNEIRGLRSRISAENHLPKQMGHSQ